MNTGTRSFTTPAAAPMAVPPGAPVLAIRGLDICLPAGADRALAVSGIDLTIEAGKTLCVVGESGSGKSMVANAVMGLLPRPHVAPVAGAIHFLGEDLLLRDEAGLRALRGRKISMIFQDPMSALNPVMRVGEQIAEVLDAHVTLSAADRRARVIAALRDVELPDPEALYDAFPFRLSGGQRQRVMIAAALVLEPALLIADEPTTALDATTQTLILELIRTLQARKHMAVMFITHDFGVVAKIADDVLVLQRGQIVEGGPAREVLRAPRHPYTKELIAAIPHGNASVTARDADAPIVIEAQAMMKTYQSGGGLFSKARKVAAVNDINFRIRRGETLGLVGESGSGKSSVGRCIAGLQAIDSGRILFNGRNVTSRRGHDPETRGRIQMVFQDPQASLNPRHKIGASILSGPLALGVPRQEAEQRLTELLVLVGLKPEAAERYPHEFSGGQRQRIGIARALAVRPDLLIADEPVSALDVSVQAQVLELFAMVRERFELSMLFITHDLRVAAQMCDHIAVMKQGVIVEHGACAQIMQAPRHDYTKKLIEAVPDFRVLLASQSAPAGFTETSGASGLSGITATPTGSRS
jgi:peptide/nickel transport system ATP-binding protein